MMEFGALTFTSFGAYHSDIPCKSPTGYILKPNTKEGTASIDKFFITGKIISLNTSVKPLSNKLAWLCKQIIY